MISCFDLYPGDIRPKITGSRAAAAEIRNTKGTTGHIQVLVNLYRGDIVTRYHVSQDALHYIPCYITVARLAWYDSGISPAAIRTRAAAAIARYNRSWYEQARCD